MKIFTIKKYNILSNIYKYSFIIIFIFLIFAPVVFSAGTTAPGTGIISKVENPLGEGNLETIPDFIKAIITIILTVGVPVVALAIIYTGFLFVAAQGNSEKITKAKKALVYTLIGAAILLGAFIVAEAIVKTVKDIGAGA